MRQNDEKKEVNYIYLMDAARMFKRSRQSLILMIKNGRVKAKKETTRWEIELSSLLNYYETRWKRYFADESKGEISITNAAKYLGITYLKLYHAISKNYVKAFKIKNSIILHKKEVDKYGEYLKLRSEIINGSRVDGDD